MVGRVMHELPIERNPFLQPHSVYGISHQFLDSNARKHVKGKRKRVTIENGKE